MRKHQKHKHGNWRHSIHEERFRYTDTVNNDTADQYSNARSQTPVNSSNDAWERMCNDRYTKYFIFLHKK